MKSFDISNTPNLIELAEEVQRTREPRVLRRDQEAVAVIVPADDSELPRAETRNARTSGPVRSFSLETIAGSVAPPTRTSDLEEMIEAAKDERAERLASELSGR